MAIKHLCDRCEAEATVTIYLGGRPIGRRCEACFEALEKQIADDAEKLRTGDDDTMIYPSWGPKRGQA